jgi:hypothetical protein
LRRNSTNLISNLAVRKSRFFSFRYDSMKQYFIHPTFAFADIRESS